MAARADRASPPLIGVIGPTASGKTELALALGQRLPVEIIAADSRQVYRGMDVGTAKPDAAARASVPHHLLDVVDPDEPFTVAQWVERARAIVPEIAARGRVAMVVGGTGLYVAALVDGHDYASQPWSPEIRQRLTDEIASGPVAETIAAIAADRGADFIVMGTHGRTGLAHVLVGSVAERVIRIAGCPVLTIREDLEAEAPHKRIA